MASHDDDKNVLPLRRVSSLIPPDGRKPDAAADVLEAAEDDLIALPQPGDPYKAHSRTDNKPLLMLRFVLTDSTVEVFSYADLRRIRLVPGGKPGEGPVLVMLFVEADVRVEGRRLDAMLDYLAYHRIAWVRELPPGKMLADKTAAVITRIVITELER
jgi:hypothetical protein